MPQLLPAQVLPSLTFGVLFAVMVLPCTLIPLWTQWAGGVLSGAPSSRNLEAPFDANLWRITIHRSDISRDEADMSSNGTMVVGLTGELSETPVGETSPCGSTLTPPCTAEWKNLRGIVNHHHACMSLSGLYATRFFVWFAFGLVVVCGILLAFRKRILGEFLLLLCVGVYLATAISWWVFMDRTVDCISKELHLEARFNPDIAFFLVLGAGVMSFVAACIAAPLVGRATERSEYEPIVMGVGV